MRAPCSRSFDPRELRSLNTAKSSTEGVASAVQPVVWVLSTGGTIAGHGGSSLSLSDYRTELLGEELVSAVPEVNRYARVRTEQISNVASNDISVAVWLRLAARINAIYATEADVSGVVVTHGTSTLEETAFFLNLTITDDRPVVLVGAQRPATALSADGPLNLVNAVRVAAAAESRRKGVLVVMNEEINAARDVTKSSTYRVETFRSGELGFLGYVDADAVVFYRVPTRRHTRDSEFDVSGLDDLPKVEILHSYAESNITTQLLALSRSGVPGIVLAGTGAGALPQALKGAITEVRSSELKANPVLVRTTRVANGRVVARKEYDDMDIVPGDNLSPQKARILLMLALSKTRDLQEIRRFFSQY